jgi:DNA-directed RNA polymerase specialized sigma24 family protein
MGGRARFQTTSWSLVLAAASDPNEARAALASLCESYWNPVYVFIRCSGYDADKSQDLTQEFFARLIEKNYLKGADRTRGRFRTFLLISVKHFLSNQSDRDRALKRGGGRAPVSFDAIEAGRWYMPPAADDVTPETLFERRWAVSLLARVIGLLRKQYVEAGKEEQYTSLAMFLNKDSDDQRYEQVAKRMGVTAPALRMSVLRMRRRYRALLRAEIAETVTSPEEIDAEIRFLMSRLDR